MGVSKDLAVHLIMMNSHQVSAAKYAQNGTFITHSLTHIHTHTHVRIHLDLRSPHVCW
jgi:hypothetical protein